MKILLNSEFSDTEAGNKFDINTIEETNLFDNSKIDNSKNNNK